MSWIDASLEAGEERRFLSKCLSGFMASGVDPSKILEAAFKFLCPDSFVDARRQI